MKLNYKILGEGEPLIILHGLLGMLDNWQAPARLLEDQFQCILVDLRNHGHSPHAPEHSYTAMMEDIIELMEQELDLSQAHFLGHSMGGKVVIKLAQEHPEKVRKLIVADIGPKYYPIHHDKIFAALRAVPLEALSKRTDAEPYMEPFVSEVGVRQFLMKSLYHPGRGVYGWRFNLDALENRLDDVGESLNELDYEGETLFIRGGKSDYITDEDWPDIKLLFPNAFLQTIEDAGHWVHAEKPKEFVAAVRDFLSDQL